MWQNLGTQLDCVESTKKTCTLMKAHLNILLPILQLSLQWLHNCDEANSIRGWGSFNCLLFHVCACLKRKDLQCLVPCKFISTHCYTTVNTCMIIQYLWDRAVEVLHIVTKARSKLAEDFLVPGVIFHVDFWLDLQVHKRRCKNINKSTVNF